MEEIIDKLAIILEQIEQATPIIEALAKSKPVYNDNNGYLECPYCAAGSRTFTEPPLSLEDHREDCPIRLAAAWLEKWKNHLSRFRKAVANAHSTDTVGTSNSGMDRAMSDSAVSHQEGDKTLVRSAGSNHHSVSGGVSDSQPLNIEERGASMSSEEEKTIWQQQEELRQWHEREYKQAYPNSKFTTGRSLYESRTKERTWEQLTDEEREHKEQIAYCLNCALFNMGTNLDGRFGDKPKEEHA